ncbi:hypothetical protein DFJ73DRAFT_897510 [Zopfochytrium polystomum]|nr:hypothetical protein DFJ73DRAFT_897510 [Zopfochytrium polystomum]
MDKAASNHAFVVKALREGVRVDGRTPYQFRAVKIALGPEASGRSEVQLGRTRVLANVSAEIVRPNASNPSEGFLAFNTSFSPMASPAFEPGKLSEEEVLVSRLLEKALRRSRAVDTEGLCIVAGEKVWSIRIDVHVLDDGGNVVDCACVAAVSALMHFKRPDVDVDGDEVRVFSADEKAPIPLSVHHIPICISFGFFDGGDRLVVDPSHEEELCQDGDMTIVVNTHREVCALSKAGGAPLGMSQIVRCAEVAAVKASEMTEMIRNALSQPQKHAHSRASSSSSSAVFGKRGMYRSTIVPQQGIDADQVYVQKIRNSLAEMNLVKETAIRTENYMLADQTRQKMVALQAQLVKMEHQLNADILINAITAWQVGLADSINKHLLDLSGFRKAVLNVAFPLKDKAHLDFLELLKILPVNYFDSLIRSLLLVLPQDLPDVPRSHFGWDALARKIPNLAKQNSDAVDVVKSMVVLSILDLMIRITDRLTMASLKRDTHTLFLKHAFHYVRNSASRRVTLDFEARLFEQIGMRWAIVVGDLASVDRTEIIRQISTALDITRKTPHEEIILILSATRYISARPTNDKEAQETVFLMHELIGHFEKNKKPVIRLAIIQALERLVQPLDFAIRVQNPELWEVGMHNELIDLHKYARRWASSSDELRAAATRLCTIIVLNTTLEYFRANVDTLMQDIFAPVMSPRNSQKAPIAIQPYVYECALQLLRGRYGYLTRPLGDETPDIVSDRLKNIAEALFINRRGPIGPDHLDACVEIIMQMGAQNLQVTLKLIAHLLTPSNPEIPEYYFIGLRSLRTMLDADSEFTVKAVCRLDPQFPQLLNDIPYEFEMALITMLQFCDNNAGIAVFDRSGTILDPIVHPSLRQKPQGLGPSTEVVNGAVNGSSGAGLSRGATMRQRAPGAPADMSNPSRNRNLYARGDDDVIAMISDALDNASIRNSTAPPTRLISSFEDPNGANSVNGEFTGVRRGSMATLASKRTPGGLSDATISEANSKVAAGVQSWYEACGMPTPRMEKIMFSSQLHDPARIKRSMSVGMVPAEDSSTIGLAGAGGPVPMRLRTDLALVLRLFKEVLRMVQYIPHPELVSGQLFVGAVLIHSQQDIAHEASMALQIIFQRFPEMRMSIINGFINYIKNTPHDDDISYCTVVLHLGLLLDFWANVDLHTTTSQYRPEDDIVYRVSCKLDACMMILLGRPNPRIRKAALSALADLHAIAGHYSPHSNVPDSMPLHLIITTRSDVIARRSLHAHLQRDALGGLLVPRAAAAVTLLTLQDVAESDFGVLFRIYLGELARQFAALGRTKALRHCAKFLRQLAIPYMTSVQAVDANFVETYSLYSVLMMSLAGVPLKSEDGYSLEPYSSSDKLLFHHFKNYLSPILNSENTWEVKSIVNASYFMHRSLLQLYILELWQWYAEMKQNFAQRLNPRMIDNTVATIRVIAQCPEFNLVVRESTVFQTSAVDIISDLLRLAEIAFAESPQFLSAGPVYRAKTAVNCCVITDRLSTAISIGRAIAFKERDAAITAAAVAAAIEGTEPVRPSMMFDPDPPGLAWDVAPRRSLAFRMRDWYAVVETDALMPPGPAGGAALGGGMPASGPADDSRRLAKLRRKLAAQIGPAAASLFALGDLFDGAPMPPDVLNWMAKVEALGHKVFTPAILYNYENALGTVLAHSYSAKGTVLAFSDAIFEQILPRYQENEDAFLSGTDGGTDGQYVAVMHGLPTAPAEPDGERATLIFPVLDIDAIEKIRQNLGSLIYFGLYNMMSSNKLVRSRAFQFIRELYCRYNPDPTVDMVGLMNKYYGVFYSNISVNLKESILDLGRLAADLFSADAPSFLWEAVRCSRSVQKAEKPVCLMPSQQLILELILPWCRYVNIANTDEDIVFAEFFRYLMDAAFYKPKHDEDVQRCWAEVAASPDYGASNCGVFAEMLVHIVGKFDRLREQACALLSRIYAAHPEVVADRLVRYLSAAAFPWRAGNPSIDPARAVIITPIVREYVNVLYTALNGGSGIVLPDPSADYAASSKAVVMLVSELLLQNNSVLFPHLPVILNYILLHLPAKLGNNSVSTYMLANLVEGRIGVLHQTQGIIAPEMAEVVEKLKKILMHLENAAAVVQWGNEKKLPDAKHVTKIPILDFIELIVSTFENDCPNLLRDLTKEALIWASDGVLNQDTSARAIQTYTTLIRILRSPPASLLNPLSSRLSEQMSILSSLEVETAATGSWERLPDASKSLRARTEDVLSSVLRLQNVLIGVYAQMNVLGEHPVLFWGGASLLNIPTNIFPQLWLMASNNCRDYLSHYDRTALKMPNTPFMAVYIMQRDGMEGLQPTLLPGLFDEDKKIQESSFDLLLQCWCSLPDEFVDHSPVGLLYTILYSLTWIFSNIYTEGRAVGGAGVTVESIASLLQETLTQKNSLEFAGIIACLQTIVLSATSSPNPPPSVLANGSPTSPSQRFNHAAAGAPSSTLSGAAIDDLLERCAANLAQIFFPACLNNVADYCLFALRLGPSQARVSMKLTQVLWSLALNYQTPASGFKALLRKLPFMVENQETARALMAYVLNEVADLDEFIKEIDLTASGRVEAVPDFERPVGSVGRALQGLAMIL